MDRDPTSVMQAALGEDYERLHPMIRRQYAIVSGSGTMCRGQGQMFHVTRGAFYVLPFLHLGARRLILFPEAGKDIPFTVENYAFTDRLGRETLTWTRTFRVPRERRFDEYLIYSERRKGLVVYAGSHQHLAVDLQVSVDAEGALIFETGAQRLYEWPLAIHFPLLFSGTAKVRESYNDALGRFEIDVTIRNRLFGHIFGYSGWFNLEQLPCEEIPASALPVRTEARD
ncbi:MAG: DUF4166 domain-containing protein [Fimbriimonas sp.]